MLESQIQKQILKYIKESGHYAIKTMVTNKAGVPDIIACINGRFVGIEVKTEKGFVSMLQLNNIDAINKSGGHAFVARSLNDVKEFLK